jgi:hypothetical protein
LAIHSRASASVTLISSDIDHSFPGVFDRLHDTPNGTNLANDKALAYRFTSRLVGKDPNSGKEIWAPHIIWEPNYVEVTATEAMQAAAEHKSPGAIRMRQKPSY